MKMKTLNKEQVLKRLTNAERNHRARIKNFWKKYNQDVTFQEYMNDKEFRTSLKYFKRLNVFKGSNVHFNPETMVASSYEWWKFVMPLKGMLVYNNYGYSNSTRLHQSKVWSLLKDLGIKIDIKVSTTESLDDLTIGSVERKLREIFKLESAIKYGNKKNVKWRKGNISAIEKEIALFGKLGLKISKKEVEKMRKTFHDVETQKRAERKAHLKAQKELVKELANKKSTFSLELGA
jgi:hypothetical protein